MYLFWSKAMLFQSSNSFSKQFFKVNGQHTRRNNKHTRRKEEKLREKVGNRNRLTGTTGTGVTGHEL